MCGVETRERGVKKTELPGRLASSDVSRQLDLRYCYYYFTKRKRNRAQQNKEQRTEGTRRKARPITRGRESRTLWKGCLGGGTYYRSPATLRGPVHEGYLMCCDAVGDGSGAGIVLCGAVVGCAIYPGRAERPLWAHIQVLSLVLSGAQSVPEPLVP